MKNKTKTSGVETVVHAPIQWEYLTEHCRNGFIPNQRLAELGERRWEMCGTVSTPDVGSDSSSAWPAVVIFYFKRPIK